MSSNPETIDISPTSRRQNRRSLWATSGFALVILIPCLYGFGGKFIEFIQLYRGDVDGVFAISPILNYLLASMGFFCLFCWAVTQGMFQDIELPKRTMLDIQNELDRVQQTKAGGAE
jgi:hypothetical protein